MKRASLSFPFHCPCLCFFSFSSVFVNLSFSLIQCCKFTMWRHVILAISILLNITHTHAFREVEPVGEWPTELYKSSSVFGTAVYSSRRSITCNNGLYIFLSPRGDSVAAHGPTILDQDGELVWTSEEGTYGAVYNLDVQTYKGYPYLTFWEGYDKLNGHGEGTIRMLDEQYVERYAIQGPNDLSADLHEFKITRDDTALFTVYDVQPADLRAVRGPERGWIWDSRFVEVDIETNEVLFDWRASEHFNVTDVTVDNPESSGWTYGHPKDFFHIHSVDKDAKGNYLISALHNDHLTYLNGRTGSIIWRLGGNHTDFEDLSKGRASTFGWPHDARFTEDGEAITLFDNMMPDDKINRGLIIDVDQKGMTVKLRSEYRAYGHNGVTPESRPQSDGSVQVLDNGNVLVSYGRNGAAWTEFSAVGVPMCHTQFGPLSSFGSGNPASYRVKKYSWHGDPESTPAFEIEGYEAYVSWNGATEVDKWVLEGAEVSLPYPEPDLETDAESDDEKIATHPDMAKSDTYFSAITTVKKTGFETKINIPTGTDHPYLRVRALDKKGLIMRTSAVLPFKPTIDEPDRPPNPPSETESHGSAGLFFAGAFATLGIAACILLVRRYCWTFCIGSYRQLRVGRRRFLPLNLRDTESSWEEYYANEEQEVGLHIVSETESDDSDIEISILDNPRLSPALLSPNPNRTPSFQSTLTSAEGGRPMLVRTPSTRSTASSRAKQQ
ncbi:arylsulfotransferase family protein [Aspergillus undulatus]|uniref:arylsulfotransferase family protein n=1 Tax=Aspergillus undulatus TaxID=1810928 RepID=UPI003CCE041C